MDINIFQQLNKLRAERWHKNASREWSLLEWAGAMAGETGEACNLAKKILRLELDLPNKEAGIDKTDLSRLKHNLAEEVSDSIIYGLLFLSEIDYNAAKTIAHVFNRKSVEYGVPERVDE
jgi:hypothetical protein